LAVSICASVAFSAEFSPGGREDVQVLGKDCA